MAELRVYFNDEIRSLLKEDLFPFHKIDMKILPLMCKQSFWSITFKDFLTIITDERISTKLNTLLDSCIITWHTFTPGIVYKVDVNNENILEYAGKDAFICNLQPGLYIEHDTGLLINTFNGIYYKTFGELRKTDLTCLKYITPEMQDKLHANRIYMFIQVAKISQTLWLSIGGKLEDYQKVTAESLELHNASIRYYE